MKKLLALIIILVLSNNIIAGQDKKQAIKKALDFYLSDRTDVVLYQFRTCEDFNFGGKPQDQCLKIKEQNFKPNQDFYVQIFLFAPRGIQVELAVDRLINEKNLDSESYKVTGSFLMILPIRVMPSESGNFTLNVYHLVGSQKVLLGSLNHQIEEP